MGQRPEMKSVNLQSSVSQTRNSSQPEAGFGCRPQTAAAIRREELVIAAEPRGIGERRRAGAEIVAILGRAALGVLGEFGLDVAS